MANITLFVPDELKKRMDGHKEIRWSRAVRDIIEQKLDDFEEAKQAAKKSTLSLEDVDRLAGEVNDSAGRHAEYLLKNRGIS